MLGVIKKAHRFEDSGTEIVLLRKSTFESFPPELELTSEWSTYKNSRPVDLEIVRILGFSEGRVRAYHCTFVSAQEDFVVKKSWSLKKPSS